MKKRAMSLLMTMALLLGLVPGSLARAEWDKPYILSMKTNLDAMTVDIQLAVEQGADPSYQELGSFDFTINYPTDRFTLRLIAIADDLPDGFYEIDENYVGWTATEEAVLISTTPRTIATATFEKNGDAAGTAAVSFGAAAVYSWSGYMDQALGSAGGCELKLGQDQTPLAFAIYQTTMTYGETRTLTAVGGSTDGAITYMSSDESVAKVDAASGVLTPLKAGKVTVTAVKAGGEVDGTVYSPVSATTRTITINKATPVGEPSLQRDNTAQTLKDVTLSAAGIRGVKGEELAGEIEWDDEESTALEPDKDYGWTFTPSGEAADKYTTLTGTLNLSRRAQTKLLIDCADEMVYAGTITLSTIGGSGDGAVAYTVKNTRTSTGGATITGNTLKATKAGTVTVVAAKAGNSLYAAATSEEKTITIRKATPTGAPGYKKIDVGGMLANAQLGYGTIHLAGKLVWVDDSGEQLSWSTVVENKEYRWRFTPTDTNYAALSGLINPTKEPQAALTISGVGETVYGNTISLTANGGSGDGAVSYAAADASTGGVTIEGNTLTATKAGIVTIVATKAGGEEYSDTTATKTIVIKRAQPSVEVSFTHIEAGDVLKTAALELTAATGVADAALAGELAWDAPDAVVEMYTRYGWTFTPTEELAVNYTAVIGGAAVTKEPQAALTITSADTMVFHSTLELTTTGGSGDGAVTWSLKEGTERAELDDTTNTLTAGAVGAVTVTAAKAGGEEYSRATATQTINIEKATPTGTIYYTRLNEGMPLSNADLGWLDDGVPGTFRWDDGDVTPVEDGKAYAWTFTPDDSDNYTELHGSITPTKERQENVPSITSGGELTYGGNLALTAGEGGVGDLTWSVQNGTGGATVTGSTLTATQAGTVTVVATWAGDGTRSEAMATKTIVIKKAQPSGTPSCHMVNEGEKLANAELTTNGITGVDGKPLAGTIVWDQDDSTIVVSEAAYGWTFTPADQTNYITRSGVLAPYAKETLYTVTVQDGTGGGTYYEGASVAITADAPKSGRYFTGWTSANGAAFADPASATTTFPMPAHNVIVTATYEAYAVTLNKTAASVTVGNTVTLTAATDPPGHAVTWSSGNTNVATVDENGKVTGKSAGSAAITARSTIGGKDYTATCAVTVVSDQPASTTYAVAISPAAGGKVTADRTTVAVGDTVTLTVTTDAGYRLTSLKVDGENVTMRLNDGKYTFTMPARNVTVTAAYEQLPQHTVTVTGGTGGGTYYEGASVAIAANAPANGERFKAWTGADGLAFVDSTATNATAIFTMPTRDVTVTAAYEAIPTAEIEKADLAYDGNGDIAVAEDETKDAAEVKLPNEVLEEIKDQENAQSLSVTMEGDTKLTFDQEALNALTAAAGDVTLSVSAKTGDAAKGSLNEKQKTTVAAKKGDTVLVLDAALAGVDVSKSFGDNGSVTVSIPYAPGENEQDGMYVVYYVDDDGKMTETGAATCENGRLSFTVPHFSRYVVLFQKYGVTLDKETASATVSGTVTLTATPVPSSAEVTWSSGNTNVATVENGVVTGKSAGSADITAAITFGGKDYTATCAVTVTSGGGGGGGGTPPKTGSSEITIGIAEGTAVPVNVTAKDDGKGGYSASIDAAQGKKIADTAKNGMTSVVIEVDVPDTATSAEVTIAAETIKALSGDTKAAVTVTSAVGVVTISNADLAELAKNGGDVSISVTSTGTKTATVSITAGGKAVTSLTGGVRVELPKLISASAGGVLVKIDSDGREEILTFSIVSEKGAMALLTGSAVLGARESGAAFSDVADNYWAKDFISFVVSHGVFSGGSDGSFHPGEAMTRAQIAQALYNIEKTRGNVYSGSDNFADVEAFRWYSAAAGWAKESGVMSGYADGSFRAGDNVTRAQIAQILCNYARKVMGLNVSASDSALDRFADRSAVGDWAAASMKWAVESKLMNGRTIGEADANGELVSALEPDSALTRGEMSALMKRFVELVLQ